MVKTVKSKTEMKPKKERKTKTKTKNKTKKPSDAKVIININNKNESGKHKHKRKSTSTSSKSKHSRQGIIHANDTYNPNATTMLIGGAIPNITSNKAEYNLEPYNKALLTAPQLTIQAPPTVEKPKIVKPKIILKPKTKRFKTGHSEFDKITLDELKAKAKELNIKTGKLRTKEDYFNAFSKKFNEKKQVIIEEPDSPKVSSGVKNKITVKVPNNPSKNDDATEDDLAGIFDPFEKDGQFTTYGHFSPEKTTTESTNLTEIVIKKRGRKPKISIPISPVVPVDDKVEEDEEYITPTTIKVKGKVKSSNTI